MKLRPTLYGNQLDTGRDQKSIFRSFRLIAATTFLLATGALLRAAGIKESSFPFRMPLWHLTRSMQRAPNKSPILDIERSKIDEISPQLRQPLPLESANSASNFLRAALHNNVSKFRGDASIFREDARDESSGIWKSNSMLLFIYSSASYPLPSFFLFLSSLPFFAVVARIRQRNLRVV